MDDKEVLAIESKRLGGNFTFRRGSIMDQFRIGKRRREMMKEFGDPDDAEWNFAYVLAAVDVLAETKPPGFAWDKVNDPAAIMEVWTQYQDWERSCLEPESDSGVEEGSDPGE